MDLTLTRRKFVAVAGAAVAAAALSLSLSIPAFASDVAYNDNAVITANAVDPTYDNNAQNIEASVTFGGSVAGVSATDMTAYLQDNITIAGRTIAPDADGYTREVSGVAINGNAVTFNIGPNTAGMTANYSAEFLLKADATQNATIAAAMGNADAETLVANGIKISRVSANPAKATFAVTDRAQARSMNHILIVDSINGVATPIFQGTGTFANGGITIHSHSFMTQTVADYAASIVDAAAGLNANYTFTDLGNGQFSISKASGSAAQLQVYVYDCDYLNTYQLSVGNIYEGELDEDGNPVA